MAEADDRYSKLEKCVKCDQMGTLAGLDPKKATYCKRCFIKAVKHKFGSAIGKRRLFKDGNRREVLILFEGDPSSAFLLSMISQGLTAEANKRLTLIPTVLVLITSTLPEEIDASVSTVSAFKGVIEARWLFVHVASILEPISSEKLTTFCGRHLVEDWKCLLRSCRNSSIRTEFVKLVRDLLCIRVAQCLGVDKIMMADCADTLSKKALSSLAFARGPSIFHLTDIVDKRFGGVSIIRPLRDICLKEIAILNRFEDSDKYIVFANDSELSSIKNSVHAVTSDFVDGQQAEGFKAVITTILSTSAKLRSASTGKDHCLFCAVMFNADTMEERFCFACSSVIVDIGEKTLVDKIFPFDSNR